MICKLRVIVYDLFFFTKVNPKEMLHVFAFLFNGFAINAYKQEVSKS